jgi:hypothetical protein
MTARTKWTDEHTQTLHRMWGEDRSDQEIAETLGRTVLSVRTKREALGLLRGRYGGVFHRPNTPPSLDPVKVYRRQEARRKRLLRAFQTDPVKPTDSLEAIRAANLMHLIDLQRAYGLPGGTLGMAKAIYRRTCELDVPPDTGMPRRFQPTAAHPLSLVGTHFSDVMR